MMLEVDFFFFLIAIKCQFYHFQSFLIWIFNALQKVEILEFILLWDLLLVYLYDCRDSIKWGYLDAIWITLDGA